MSSLPRLPPFFRGWRAGPRQRGEVGGSLRAPGEQTDGEQAHRTPGNPAPCLGYQVSLKASRARDHFPCRSTGLGQEPVAASPEGCGGPCPNHSARTGHSSSLPPWWAGTPHHPTSATSEGWMSSKPLPTLPRHQHTWALLPPPRSEVASGDI